MKIPKTHPRYISLTTRHVLEHGVKTGITSLNGLIAHGRGEAFDYLLGEKTHTFAKEAIAEAANVLLAAKHPVISVNGNTAALVAKEFIILSKLLRCPLEVNIFHTSKKREQKIKKHLLNKGAKDVFLAEKKYVIDGLLSNRRYVNGKGIYLADVVFVPLEDGDRAEALIKNGKKVITIDLNPLSRTAKTATITIIDNIVRALPLLVGEIIKQKKSKKLALQKYDNKQILKQAVAFLRKGKYGSGGPS
ncbi:MAG: phosphopantothenate/pantothenate synthetase [Candidatus Levyibacteriota bacterium]|nr:MAG: phosphopantothenate/pantothenate synthetase [Candidatus Levybacteria bacterium]